MTKVYINFNSTNIAEPFEWFKTKNTGEVFYKSQNPYTYNEANDYCNQLTEKNWVQENCIKYGCIHPSQLWKINTDDELENKQSGCVAW